MSNYKTKKEQQVAEFAEELIAEHLGDGWSFEIDRRSRRTYGWCEYNRITGGGRIAVAAFMIEHADDDEIIDTVTHELSHAIVGPGEGHGPKWQATHKALGGNGKRYGRAIPGAPKGKYEATCPACNKRGIAYRWRIAPTMRRATHNSCGLTIQWLEIETGQELYF